MITERDVQVTTTPEISGWDVQSYEGVVTAHIVTGANLFSDIFASFSDIFGGRSKSYQKQLTKINKEALDILRRQAADRGANCVVGVHIDHDQVTGQGKSMFMVKASGTAVRAELPDESGGTEHDGTMSAEELADEVRRRELVEDVEEDSLVVDDETWDDLRRLRVHEASPPVLMLVKSKFDEYKNRAGSAHDINLVKEARRYLMSLPPRHVRPQVYNFVGRTEGGMRGFLGRVIRDMQVVDFKHNQRLLEAEDHTLRRWSLYLVWQDKHSYTQEDLPVMRSMMMKVGKAFPEIAEVIEEERGTFSKSRVEIWKCPRCEKKNELDQNRCQDCTSDRRGFKRNDLKPEDVIPGLRRRIESIEARFSDGQGSA